MKRKIKLIDALIMASVIIFVLTAGYVTYRIKKNTTKGYQFTTKNGPPVGTPNNLPPFMGQ